MEIKHTYLECLRQLKAQGVKEIHVPYLCSTSTMTIDDAIEKTESFTANLKDQSRNFIVINNTIYELQRMAQAVA